MYVLLDLGDLRESLTKEREKESECELGVIFCVCVCVCVCVCLCVSLCALLGVGSLPRSLPGPFLSLRLTFTTTFSANLLIICMTVKADLTLMLFSRSRQVNRLLL